MARGFEMNVNLRLKNREALMLLRCMWFGWSKKCRKNMPFWLIASRSCQANKHNSQKSKDLAATEQFLTARGV